MCDTYTSLECSLHQGNAKPTSTRMEWLELPENCNGMLSASTAISGQRNRGPNPFREVREHAPDQARGG